MCDVLWMLYGPSSGSFCNNSIWQDDPCHQHTKQSFRLAFTKDLWSAAWSNGSVHRTERMQSICLTIICKYFSDTWISKRKTSDRRRASAITVIWQGSLNCWWRATTHSASRYPVKYQTCSLPSASCGNISKTFRIRPEKSTQPQTGPCPAFCLG